MEWNGPGTRGQVNVICESAQAEGKRAINVCRSRDFGRDPDTYYKAPDISLLCVNATLA